MTRHTTWIANIRKFVAGLPTRLNFSGRRKEKAAPHQGGLFDTGSRSEPSFASDRSPMGVGEPVRGARAARRGHARQDSHHQDERPSGHKGSASRGGMNPSGHRRARFSQRDQSRLRQGQYEGWSQQERSALYLSAHCRFGLCCLSDAGSLRLSGAAGPTQSGTGLSQNKFSLGFDWDDDVVFLEMDVTVGAAGPVSSKDGRSGTCSGSPLENERLRCPISLDTLELPVVLPCGHVFSLISLATDLVLRETLCGPCPICTREVAARELKPLQVRVLDPVERNRAGTWRLMRLVGEDGEKVAACVGSGEGHCRVEDRHAAENHGGVEGMRFFSYPIDMPDGSRFQERVMVENPEDLYRYMVCCLATRSEEVAAEGGAESGHFYLGYVTAIDIVVEIARRMVTRLRGLDAGAAVVVRLRADVDGVIAANKRKMVSVRRQERFDQEFPSLVTSGCVQEAAVVDLGSLRVQCRGSNIGVGQRRKEVDETTRHFYQSGDGQRYYLNELNTDMLRRAGLPLLVSGPRVLDVEVYEQTMATRNARGHEMYGIVPLSATIGVCEVDLRGFVPEGVTDEFKAQVDKNREERENKALKAFMDHQDRQKAAKAARQAEAEAVTAMLESMPRLGVTGPDEGLQLGDMGDMGEGASDPITPSWAILAKDGFAATGPSLGGPALGGSSSPSPVLGTSPNPAWGPSMSSATLASSWAPTDMTSNLSKTKTGGKGKKVTLFSSSSGRRRY